MTTYDQQSLADLNDRTRYELWLLEAAYAIADEILFPEWPDQIVYPANGDAPSSKVFMSGNVTLGDWRPKFLKVGAPLIFVTTFKLLDMLIEWVLDQNGVPSKHQFKYKKAALRDQLQFPPCVASRDWLQERLVGLYGHLEPLRGTIVHARHFKSSDGALHVSSSKGNTVGPVVTLEPKDLRSLAVFLISVLRYVSGSWELDAYREKFLRRSLDELAHLHHLPSLGQQSPRFLTVRVYTAQWESIEVDIARIRHDVRRMCPGQDSLFDLRIVAVTPDGRASAYCIPWSELRLEGDRFVRRFTELSTYHTDVPSDVEPSRVAQDLKVNPPEKRVTS